MTETRQNQTKSQSVFGRASELITNKQSRSIVILVLSFLFILGINSLLPVIEGDTHYTAEATEVTYGEYLQMKHEDTNYRLTWKSEREIERYINKYIDAHPELTDDERLLVTAPDNFRVKVYTKFFYEYTFWYITTIISVGSSIIFFYSIFNYLITRAKERFKKYVDMDSEMSKMTDKYLDPVTFEPWMDDDFNYRRKVDQHKRNVKYQIDKLERKTRYAVKRKLRDYFRALHEPSDVAPKDVLENLGKLSWREHRYLKNKEKYLSLLEDDYINEYVINGRVKYFQYIFPMFVYHGNNGIGRTTDGYSTIQSDSKKITSDAANKVLLTVITTVLFAVMLTVTAVGASEQEPLWIVINAVAKIAPLMLQIPLAIDYSNHFMNNHLITNMIKRRTIALLYLADMAKRGQQSQQVQQVQEHKQEEIKLPVEFQEYSEEIKQIEKEGDALA